MSEANIINIIDKATSEYLIGTDWSLNLQLCDALNNDPNGIKEAIKHVAKRMKEKKSRVALLALELIETLVKNCEVVHPYVGGKEFQADIIKVAQNKKIKDNVRERLLELVQYWADSFQKRHDLPLFAQTYFLLRKSGVTFPPRRKDEPPLVFKNAPPAVSRSTSSPIRDVAPSKETSSIRESANLCIEMLAYFNVEEEDPNTNDLLKDLIQTCKDALPNVRSAIESGTFKSEDDVMELLALNDDITKMGSTFDELVVQREKFLKRGPASAAKPSPAPATDFLDFTDSLSRPFDKMSVKQSQPQQQSLLSIDDEFGFIPANPQVVSQPRAPVATATSVNPFSLPPAVNPGHVPITTAKVTHDEFDEFDMLAKSRHSTSPSAPVPVLSPLPIQTTTPFQQPYQQTFQQTFQQPFVTQQNYRPQQIMATPFQPQAPFLAPLQPQAPFLAPLQTQPNTGYPNINFQPAYAAYPHYGAPKSS